MKRTGVVSPEAGGCGEKLHMHVVLEPEWVALDMGQCPVIEECDECMGQFLQQQQAEETQQPLPWPFSANNDAPGRRERRSESDKAQALFVISMPCFLYSK